LWAERKEGIKYHQLIQYSLENCGLLSSPFFFIWPFDCRRS
jgi:hypothetical protein